MKRLTLFIDDFCCSATYRDPEKADPVTIKALFSSEVLTDGRSAFVFPIADASEETIAQLKVEIGGGAELFGLEEALAKSGSDQRFFYRYVCSLIAACVQTAEFDPEGNPCELWVAIPLRNKTEGKVCRDAVAYAARTLHFKKFLLGDAHQWAAEYAFRPPFKLDAPEVLESLAERLVIPVDELSRWLQKKLLPETRKSLKDFLDGKGNQCPRTEVAKALGNDLNRLVGGPSLYDPELFPPAVLRPETQQLIASKPKEGNMQRLNMLLLEDAFPIVRLSPATAGRFATICLWRRSFSCAYFATADAASSERAETRGEMKKPYATKFLCSMMELLDHQKQRPKVRLEVARTAGVLSKPQVIIGSGAGLSTFVDDAHAIVDSTAPTELTGIFDKPFIEADPQISSACDSVSQVGVQDYLLIGALALHDGVSAGLRGIAALGVAARTGFARWLCGTGRILPSAIDGGVSRLGLHAILAHEIHDKEKDKVEIVGRSSVECVTTQAKGPATNETGRTGSTIIYASDQHGCIVNYRNPDDETKEVQIKLELNNSEKNLDVQFEYKLSEDGEINLRAWLQGQIQGQVKERTCPISTQANPEQDYPKLIPMEIGSYSLVVDGNHEVRCETLKDLRKLCSGGVHVFNAGATGE